MKLFEGGILDKITNDEYEKMFQRESVDVKEDEKVSGEQEGKADENNGRQSMNTKAKKSNDNLSALNLRMLQGAFYLVLMGHIIALVTLILEIQCRKPPKKIFKRFKRALCMSCKVKTLRVVQWFRDLKLF